MAVSNAALKDEIALIVAAAGHQLVHQDPMEPTLALWRRAPAIFLDSATANLMAPAALRALDEPDTPDAPDELDEPGAEAPVNPLAHTTALIFLVRPDTEEPDTAAEELLDPDYSVALPAHNIEVIEALGRPEHTASRSDSPRVSAPIGAGEEPHGGFALACLPAVGGAGASVLAASLALVWAHRRPVALIDADATGGGVDLVLGMEHQDGLRWQEFSSGQGAVDGHALFEALPAHPHTPALRLLTCPRERGSAPVIDAEQVVAVAASLIHAGYAVIIDLPRQEALVRQVAAFVDQLALVVPAGVRAIAAASSWEGLWQEVGITPELVVRQQRHRDIATADVEYALGIPISGEIAYLKNLPRHLDLGGVGGIAAQVLRELPRLVGLPEVFGAESGYAR